MLDSIQSARYRAFAAALQHLDANGDGDAALRLGRSLLGRSVIPEQWPLRNAYSLLLIKNGMPGEAVELYKRWLASSPSTTAEWHKFAGALTGAGASDDELLRVYSRILQIDPSDPMAYLGLGEAKLATGDLAGAVAAWRKGLRLEVDSILILENLESAYAQLGRERLQKEMKRRIDEYYEAHPEERLPATGSP